MFSVVFPGQGSQSLGMGKEFFDKFDRVKKLFKEADEILNVPISKYILDGPKDKLDLTFNTQPAIFLVSFSIFSVIKNEFNINLHKAKYFAGHSLGEYSALSCADSLSFAETILLLKKRGNAMQNAVPNGEGGMIAILGSTVEIVETIMNEKKDISSIEIANDNSIGQIVLSGKNKDLEKLSNSLKEKNIKNIKLAVSAPFHCKLMTNATEAMKLEIENTNFKDFENILISNVTANEVSDTQNLKKLLVDQIEHRVRWRESIIFMIEKGVETFVEIGPGKVLSGLIKRINKDVKIYTINSIDDIKDLKNV